jgi:hypothetical protein
MTPQQIRSTRRHLVAHACACMSICERNSMVLDF